MTRSLFYSFAVLITATLTIASCSVRSDFGSNPVTSTTQKNTPVIASTLNAYTLTIDAQSFTSTRSDTVVFNSDSLALTLTIGNFSEGTGNIEIFNNAGTSFYSESLAGNKVIALSGLSGNVPKMAVTRFTNYTGSYVFTLSKRSR
jgi:hypothetical protein